MTVQREHSKRLLETSSTTICDQFLKCLFGNRSAGDAPVHELGDIDPALAGFALMHSDMRDHHFFGQITLGQCRSLAHLPEHSGQASISLRMLGFCHLS